MEKKTIFNRVHPYFCTLGALLHLILVLAQILTDSDTGRDELQASPLLRSSPENSDHQPALVSICPAQGLPEYSPRLAAAAPTPPKDSLDLQVLSLISDLLYQKPKSWGQQSMF